MTFFTEYNESKENLVEVDIDIDVKCSIPQVGKDGTIKFQTAYPAGDSFLSLRKVKVPKEAVVSQEALRKYFAYKQEAACEEFVHLTDPNIWDEDDKHEYGGAFRF